MGLGTSPAGVLTALIPCLPMFFSTWETYHTHVLYLGYFNGPTGMYFSWSASFRHLLTVCAEGLIIACTLMVISGACGPEIWTMKLKDTIGDHSLLGEYSFRDLWVPIIVSAFMIAHLPACVHNVVQARKRQNLPVLPVFLEWTPIIIFSASCWLWLASPHTSLLTDNRLVLFCLTLSFVFGRMTTKIILAHLTKQPFPYWTILLAPLMGGAFFANLPSIGLYASKAPFFIWINY